MVTFDSKVASFKGGRLQQKLLAGSALVEVVDLLLSALAKIRQPLSSDVVHTQRVQARFWPALFHCQRERQKYFK